MAHAASWQTDELALLHLTSTQLNCRPRLQRAWFSIPMCSCMRSTDRRQTRRRWLGVCLRMCSPPPCAASSTLLIDWPVDICTYSALRCRQLRRHYIHQHHRNRCGWDHPLRCVRSLFVSFSPLPCCSCHLLLHFPLPLHSPFQLPNTLVIDRLLPVCPK